MELIESIMSESNLMKAAAAVRRNKGAAGVDNIGAISQTFVNRRKRAMELIESIMSESNLMKAAAAVRRNKGAAGVDNMNVFEGTQYLKDHQEEIRQAVNSMKYRPQPVRRVYIPKPNGKKRGLGIPTVIDRTIQQATAQILENIFDPCFSEFSFGFRPGRSAHDGKKRGLGIPTVIDRTIQQATAQILENIFDPCFSEFSFGFRPGRSAHDAVMQALEYLNDGYQWVIDLDIEKFFGVRTMPSCRPWSI